MNTIILDMYGVVIKAPEGDLIPYIKNKFPDKAENEINLLWKEAAYGRITSQAFFRRIGFSENIKAIEKDYLETIEIDELFFDIANHLKEKYRLALLSNDVSEWSRYLQDKYNFKKYFDEIVISGDIALLKPDPKIFEILLDRINQPASACYYVDDREKNILVAKQMGMDAILFNRKNIPYDGIEVNSFHQLSSYFHS